MHTTAGRRLIKTLVSNSTFDRGSLSPTYVKPFDLFAAGAKHWRLARRTGQFPQLVDSRSSVNRDCFATISPSLADLYRRHVTGLTSRTASAGR